MGALRKCISFAKWIAAKCPYCLEVNMYREKEVKRKKKNGEFVLECEKCHAEFRLGSK
jgi:phage FluMu protein Com